MMIEDCGNIIRHIINREGCIFIDNRLTCATIIHRQNRMVLAEGSPNSGVQSTVTVTGIAGYEDSRWTLTVKFVVQISAVLCKSWHGNLLLVHEY